MKIALPLGTFYSARFRSRRHFLNCIEKMDNCASFAFLLEWNCLRHFRVTLCRFFFVGIHDL